MNQLPDYCCRSGYAGNHQNPSEGASMSQHRIAVIAGDGIGTEVMPEGIRVL